MKINNIKIRMYRHGFGDCFLLQFYQEKTRKFSMLIDCGLKLNDSVAGITLADVRDDIARELTGGVKGKKPALDVLVATHEHWDHVSGFHPDEGLFRDFSIDKLWFAWTEDPKDEDAKILNKGLAKRIKALHLAAKHLKKKTIDDTSFYANVLAGDRQLKLRKEFQASLQDVLGFYGAVAVSETPGGIRVRDSYKVSIDTQKAMDHLRTLPKKGEAGVEYLFPGKLIDENPLLPGVRIYVLGPPKSKLLNKAAPSTGGKKEVYFGDSSLAGFVEGVLAMDTAGLDGVDEGKPFKSVTMLSVEDAKKNPFFKRSYFNPDEAYRMVDYDWLDMAGALAMQMDSDTNNTSLVLAIELVESSKVLLFTGDAQVGSWLSWHDLEWKVKDGDKTKAVNAADLLSRTVFYKVGHHSSHNATLKEKGLELMTSEDLVAFVPEKEKQYNGIPYKPLLKKLREKTRGRLIVSADKNYPAEDILKKKPDGLSKKEWTAFKKDLTIGKLFVEYTVNG